MNCSMRWVVCSCFLAALPAGCSPLAGSQPVERTAGAAAAPASEALAAIIGIWTEQGKDAASLWIEGARELVFSAVAKPGNEAVSLFFPDTVIAGQAPVPGGQNGLIRAVVARQADAPRPTSIVDVSLSAPSGYDIRRHGTLLRLVFQPMAKAADRDGLKRSKAPAVEKPPQDQAFALRAQSRKDRAVVGVHLGKPVENYNYFTVEYPPRIVFDLLSVKAPSSKSAIFPAFRRQLRRIDWEIYPDRIRLTLETSPEMLRAFTAKTVEEGLRIEIGPAPEGRGAADPDRPGEDSAPSPLGDPEASFRALAEKKISAIEVRSLAGGKTSLVVRTTAGTGFRLEEPDSDRLLLVFPGARIPKPLRTFHFDNGALKIMAEKGADADPALSIAFERPAPYYVETGPAGVAIHFSATALEAAAPTGSTVSGTDGGF